jgi:hypothetical protein
MSIARDRRRLAGPVGWTLLAAVLALGGAGLVAQLSHPPGDDRRAELTWAADRTLAAGLDDIAAQLDDVGARVDALADDAKAALVAVSAGDATALKAALDRGAGRAAGIDAAVARLRGELAALPGDGPDAATEYSNAVLVRRAALGTALDAVGTLSDAWARVTARSSDAAALTAAIRNHDATIASAAAAGVAARYADAIGLCSQAIELLDRIAQLRASFVQAGDVTVLDDWLARQRRHDGALLALYRALKASGGVRNPVVDAAYREEQSALAELPPDNRAIIVIIAGVAQGGLNQAVVAIEDASGRLDQAISAAAPS